jgi:ATP-dependent Zn protease
MGAERNITMTTEALKKTAYYKTGNALVALKCKGSDSIRKVTILNRGTNYGGIFYSNDKDQSSYSRIQLLAIIKRIFGGRIGEELFTGKEKVTSGLLFILLISALICS